MSNQRLIKRRITTAKNISQITKAMEMVSATKMKRAQRQALAARPYTKALQSTLQKLSQMIDPGLHPLLSGHDQGYPVLLLIGTDKGLVGALNNHLFKAAHDWIHNNPEGKVVAVGRKAVRFCQLAGAELEAQFTDVDEVVTTQTMVPITTLLSTNFLDKKYSSVTLIYMDFINTLTQKSRSLELLPMQQEAPKQSEKMIKPEFYSEYLFEPSAEAILSDLLPYYLENTIYQSFLEARASEHSSRMVAMKNASENASDLVGELRLSYNKTRQANITNELLDITTASMSIN